MIRITYTLFSALAFVFLLTPGLGQTRLNKKYHVSGNESANAIIQTDDGGYLLTGTVSDNLTANVSDVLLIKTDSLGEVLWTRTIRTNRRTEGMAVTQTSDGGYLVGANRYNTGLVDPIQTDWWLLKFNGQGDTVWTRVTGSPENDRIYRVAEEASGTFLAVGYMDFGGFAVGTFVRYNAQGERLLTKYFTSQTALIKDIDLDDLGDMKLTGSGFSGTHEFVVYQFNSFNNVISTKTFGVANFADFGTSLSPVAGGYYLSGISGFITGFKPLFYRLDASMDTVWRRRLTQYSTPTLSQEIGIRSDANAQNELFAAFTAVDNLIDYQGKILRFSPDGDITFDRSFGSSDYDYFKDLVVNTSGLPVACGQTKEPDSTHSDAWLLIPDLNFTTTQEQVRSNRETVYPNPASNRIFATGIKPGSLVSVWNTQGKCLLKESVLATEGLGIQNLPDGLYFLRITEGNSVRIHGFTKEK